MSNEVAIRREPAFTSTHWSQVASASDASSPHAAAALAQLCRTYWYPLYAFIRREGYEADRAQDLTQEFFARLLEKEFFASANREKGRLRSFLLVALKRLPSPGFVPAACWPMASRDSRTLAAEARAEVGG